MDIRVAMVTHEIEGSFRVSALEKFIIRRSAIVGGFMESNCSRRHIGRLSLFPTINLAAKKNLASYENRGFISVSCTAKDCHDISSFACPLSLSLSPFFSFLFVIIARPLLARRHQFPFFLSLFFFLYAVGNLRQEIFTIML